MTISDAAYPAAEQSVLDDLRNRLSAFRRVPLPVGFGWSRGVVNDF